MVEFLQMEGHQVVLTALFWIHNQSVMLFLVISIIIIITFIVLKTNHSPDVLGY